MLVSYFNTAGGKVAAFEVTSLYGVIHPLSIIIIWHVLEEGQGACLSSLLSLVPPSCMVAPNRELANTLFPFDTSTLFNPMVQNNINMDMDIDTPRGRSAIHNSRELLAHSSVSSIPYVERMETQSNNPSWADQVELNELQELTLSYANPEVGEINPITRL